MSGIMKLVLVFFRIIPFSLALFLGRIAGFFFYLRTRRRNIALVTVKEAFPQKTFRQAYALVKSGFLNLGLSLAEILVMDKMKEKIRVDFEEEPVPGGQVVVGIHQGNWELYNCAFAAVYPMAILVKEQKNKVLNEFLNGQRKKQKLILCETIKDLLRWLKKDYWTGLMVDHGAETNARYSSFFGHKVPSPGGAVRIAKKFKKKIYPAFGLRRGLNYILHVGPALDTENSEEGELIDALNLYYEKMISEYPENYLWSFRRFKKKKDRSVLVLSDGKPGHVKQSLGLVYVLRDTGYDLRVKEQEIIFKGRIKRILADLAALLCRFSWCRGELFLRFLLPGDVFRALDRDFFDIVISTGSSMSSLNLLVSRLNNARSCHILKPNLPLSFFDLTLLPEHDLCKGSNTLTIKGALTRFDDLENSAQQGRVFFKFNEKKKIALFIGGSQNDEKGFLANLDLFLKELMNFSREKDYQILATTSRRTSRKAEQMISDALKDFPNTEVLVVASEKNYSFVVPSFLSFSDIVFVTAESVSMISESAVLDKNTVAVFLEKINKPQHRRFLESLKDGFVNFLSFPYNDFSFKSPERSLAEENEAVLKEAARRLI